MVVRRIFREYLQGASLKNITDGLMADGIPTATGNMKWRSDGIRKILTNEKYMGDALLQKTYTVDVLTKKRVANNGIVPQYYVENNHEAIIPRQLFMQVQEELQRRAHLRTENGKTKRVYSSKYALSSIIYCGKCGGSFSEELRGKPEVHLITNGDVPAELRRDRKTAVMPRQSVNLKFKKQS